MNEPIFKATFSDFKNIKTRKVLQLIFEVPAEEADAAMAVLGGVPQADKERWVAVARLNPTKGGSEATKPDKSPSERERQKWVTMPPAKQAAIRCNDPVFMQFVKEIKNADCAFGVSCAEAVRELCGVTSRADILEGTRAAEKWAALDREFLAWRSI